MLNYCLVLWNCFTLCVHDKPNDKRRWARWATKSNIIRARLAWTSRVVWFGILDLHRHSKWISALRFFFSFCMWENHSKNQIKSIIFNDNFISMFFPVFSPSLSHTLPICRFFTLVVVQSIYFHSFHLLAIDKNDDHFAYSFLLQRNLVRCSRSLCMLYSTEYSNRFFGFVCLSFSSAAADLLT